MTKKLKWRLADRPTPSEVTILMEKEIISKDEAREILFSEETEETKGKKDLESEIKFLRELVEKLSAGKTSTIVETIHYIERPYLQRGWYHPYQVWCTNLVGSAWAGNSATANALNTNMSAQSLLNGGAYTTSVSNTSASSVGSPQSKFSSIKTF